VREPADVGGALRALELGNVADAEEGWRTSSGCCMVMCRRTCESSPAGPPRPNASVMMPMCSIEEYAKQALDVAAPVEHETRETAAR